MLLGKTRREMLVRLAVLSLCVGAIVVACLKPAGVRYPGLPTLEQGALQVINFNVGQADALLLIYKGKTLLADCGSPLRDPLKASRTIPRRLDALLGKRHIDYFLVTHYHFDHLGGPGRQSNRKHAAGIYSLIEREGVTIGTVLDRGFWFIGKTGATQKHYERHSKRWLKQGIAENRRVVRPGDKIDMGEGLDVEIVSASGNGMLDRLKTLFPSFIKDARPSENDYSVGIKATLGDFELFSAGDLSGQNVIRQYGSFRETYTDVESWIAESIGPVEMYRVNHHGSRHSTNDCFAQVLHPQVSVFSTGDNKYGHPDPGVYDRLKGYGDVYITGGADPRYKAQMVDDIVGDDVEVLVAPEGDRFWVNGKPYQAANEATEQARPNYKKGCYDTEKVEPLQPAEYEVLDGVHSGD